MTGFKKLIALNPDQKQKLLTGIYLICGALSKKFL